MKLIQKRYVKGLVVAAALVAPLQYSAINVQADTKVVEQVAQSIPDGTYNIELKIYKDKTNEESIAELYFTGPQTLTVKDGKRYVTTTITNASYFQYLKTEDIRDPDMSHDAKVISVDEEEDTKVVQFEVGRLSKKLNMDLYILIPGMNYEGLHEVQFKVKMLDPGYENVEQDEVFEVTGPDVVHDPVLKSYINQELARETLDAPISAQDLLRVKYLEVYEGYQIKDYSALEKMENLESLFINSPKKIDNMGIKDLTPLSKLQKLRVLSIENHQITDLKPIANVSSLKMLHLRGNDVVDVSPLSGMNNLKNLNISKNKIEDIKPVFKLLGLEKLNVNSNSISHIDGIEQLKQLDEIEMGWNNISNISSLQGLMKLSKINVSGNKISDIRPLGAVQPKTKMLMAHDQRIDLNKAVVGEETEIPIYYHNGKVPTIEMKSEDGTYENGSIKWGKAGSNTFKFAMRESSTYFSGVATQEVGEPSAVV
ncbi:TPA: NEAT domain-containing protein, partial [Bacillus cereus]|nr:NEAT domain-containing protein [Bacillus cereus]